jgi:hypothetical protein
MPSTFSADATARLVRFHFDTAPDSLGERLDAVLRSPRYARGFGFVQSQDRRGPGLSASQIQDVAAVIRSHAPRIAPCRWAVVVTTEEDLAAARVLALLTRGTGVSVAPFTSLSSAEQWASESSQT